LVKQCLAVRTKAGELPRNKAAVAKGWKYLLEAQLENMAEESICLEVRGSF
jgi:hypothetical protein